MLMRSPPPLNVAIAVFTRGEKRSVGGGLNHSIREATFFSRR